MAQGVADSSTPKKTAYPFKTRLVLAALVSFAFVFSVLLFIPYELYLGNTADFSFTFGYFWGPIALVGAGVFVVLTGLLCLCRGWLFRSLAALVFGFTLAGYIQSMFMNGMMQDMNGVEETWSGPQVIGNLVIWLVVALIPLVISLFWQKLWQTIVQFGSAALVVIQAVALLSMSFSTTLPAIDSRLTDKGLLEVSGNGKNVVLFVLDKFDQTYMDKALSVDPEVTDGLKGFTYYPDATGSYCYTHVAMPYFLSGVHIGEYNPTDAQLTETLESSPYFGFLSENVEDIGIYTGEKYIPSKMAQNRITNFQSAPYQLNGRQIIKTSLKSSFYRIMPFQFKPYFAYYSGEFNEAIEVQDGVEYNFYNPETHMTDADLLDSLEGGGIQVNEDTNGSYRLIHLAGVHEPLHLDEKGDYREEETSHAQSSAGELKIVAAYAKALEEKGLFRDATIIVTGDHGATWVLEEGNDDNINVNPLFLYKPAGVGYDTAFSTSAAPVSHADIFPTVVETLGGDGEFYGRVLDTIAEGEERERYYYWCRVNPIASEYESHLQVEYAINGDARELSNWKETGKVFMPHGTTEYVLPEK